MSEDYPLQRAYQLMFDAHKGQVDKQGQPYFHHPSRVARAVRQHGRVAMIVGYLHDVAEDTLVSVNEIREKFGPEIADAVDALTHRKGVESYRQYIERVSQHPIARIVKMADLRDNLSRIAELAPDVQNSLQPRYVKALLHLDNALLTDLQARAEGPA